MNINKTNPFASNNTSIWDDEQDLISQSEKEISELFEQTLSPGATSAEFADTDTDHISKKVKLSPSSPSSEKTETVAEAVLLPSVNNNSAPANGSSVIILQIGARAEQFDIKALAERSDYFKTALEFYSSSEPLSPFEEVEMQFIPDLAVQVLRAIETNQFKSLPFLDRLKDFENFEEIIIGRSGPETSYFITSNDVNKIKQIFVLLDFFAVDSTWNRSFSFMLLDNFKIENIVEYRQILIQESTSEDFPPVILNELAVRELCSLIANDHFFEAYHLFNAALFSEVSHQAIKFVKEFGFLMTSYYVKNTQTEREYRYFEKVFSYFPNIEKITYSYDWTRHDCFNKETSYSLEIPLEMQKHNDAQMFGIFKKLKNLKEVTLLSLPEGASGFTRYAQVNENSHIQELQKILPGVKIQYIPEDDSDADEEGS